MSLKQGPTLSRFCYILSNLHNHMFWSFKFLIDSRLLLNKENLFPYYKQEVEWWSGNFFSSKNYILFSLSLHHLVRECYVKNHIWPPSLQSISYVIIHQMMTSAKIPRAKGNRPLGTPARLPSIGHGLVIFIYSGTGLLFDGL